VVASVERFRNGEYRLELPASAVPNYRGRFCHYVWIDATGFDT
jgi:hypothetical protein